MGVSIMLLILSLVIFVSSSHACFPSCPPEPDAPEGVWKIRISWIPLRFKYVCPYGGSDEISTCWSGEWDNFPNETTMPCKACSRRNAPDTPQFARVRFVPPRLYLPPFTPFPPISFWTNARQAN